MRVAINSVTVLALSVMKVAFIEIADCLLQALGR
jgi:hypothetical protein